MELPKKINLPPLRQLGIVVKDLEASAAGIEQHFDVGPFNIFEFDQKGIIEDGTEICTKIKVGMAEMGPVQIEFIQPLEGENTYSDFLRRRGDGLHHLAYEVDSLAFIDTLEQAGGKRVFHYDLGNFGWAYLEMPMFGDTLLELLRPGAEPA